MTWSNDGFQGRAISFGADEAKQIYFVRTKFLSASEPGLWRTGWRRQKLSTKLCASWPRAWLPSHTALIKVLPPLSHASVMEAGCLLSPASFLFFYVKLSDFAGECTFPRLTGTQAASIQTIIPNYCPLAPTLCRCFYRNWVDPSIIFKTMDLGL